MRELANYSTIQLTDYGYTGQRNLDESIGLMDYKFRMYSDTLGRFISPDNIVPDATNPQAWNRFSYVNNRPINFNDPSGHCATGAIVDTVLCVAFFVGLAFTFSGMSDTPKNFSPEEAEAKANSFYLGTTIIAGVGSIRNPIIEYVSNMIDCAIEPYACITTQAIPGSTSATHNAMEGYTDLLPPPKPFGNSGTIILTEDEFLEFGNNYGSHRGYTFVANPSDVDAFEFATLSEIEHRLGRSFPEGSNILRADIDDLSIHNPRVPDTSITGNSNFLGTGYTSGGLPELIINPVNLKIRKNASISQLQYVR